MKGKTLSGALIVLGFGLGMVLLVPERTVSRLMETCGALISEVFGL